MSSPNAFDGMMHEFCVGLGFCGAIKDGKRQHVTQYIPNAGPVTAQDFARWVIVAEGRDPDLEERWVVRLQAVFVQHMGANTVDAGALRSDYPGI